MGIPVQVYTSGADEPRTLTLVNAEGPFRPSEERPAVMLVSRVIGGRPYVHAEFAEERGPGLYFPKRPGGAGPMFGGAFIYTSDSRFSEATGNGHGSPVALHNRFESESGVTHL